MLEDALGGTIQDFVYDDENGWPEGPDGEGPSLVLINPTSDPNHGDPASWRSSETLNGNPGGEDARSYASWALVNGVTSLTEDLDGDGLEAGFEYLAGTSPTDPAPKGHPVAVSTPMLVSV